MKDLVEDGELHRGRLGSFQVNDCRVFRNPLGNVVDVVNSQPSLEFKAGTAVITFCLKQALESNRETYSVTTALE
jgi:hypothetical protein